MNYAGGTPAFLLHNGITVAAISYRLTCSGVTGREMMEDVSDAVDFIKRTAANNEWSWKIDPNKIILLGASAGGHLSLLASFHKRDPSIRGVVSMYGPTELRHEQLFEKSISAYEQFAMPFYVYGIQRVCSGLLYTSTTSKNATALAEEVKTCMEDLSPVAKAHSESPPILLIHGQQDPIVPVAHGKAFVFC